MILILKAVLIDDEEIILNGMTKIIDWEASGFSIVGTFSDSEEAVAEIKKLKPHLVITDIEMPALSGLDLISVLHKIIPSAKFVVLSAHDQFRYAQQALHLGVFRYILKPINKTELLKILEEVRSLFVEQNTEQGKSEDIQNQRLLKSMVVHDAICDGFIHRDNKMYTMYEKIYSSFSYQFIFLHLRKTLNEQFEYKSCSEAVFIAITEYCKSKLQYTDIFRHENDLVFILENPVKEKDLMLLIEDIGVQWEQTAIIGITPFFSDLTEGHSRLIDSSACFKNMLFFSDDAKLLYISHKASTISDNLSELLEEAKSLLPSILCNANLEMLIELFNNQHKKLRSLNTQTVPLTIHSFYQAMLHLIFHTIEELQQTKSSPMPITLRRFLYLEDYHQYITSIIKRSFWEATASIGDNSTGIVNSVKHYIHMHYMESDLNLSDIADRFHINYSYLSHLFKKRTGVNFSSYLTLVRVEAAKKLLRQTPLPVSEIARRVGFQDPQNFYRAFKKNYNDSPRSYREVEQERSSQRKL